ncbi:RHS repeat-associated core domain-containing protein [Desulfosporosinus nitroreducens]|uniref:RHS repeat-associated core domain-containing protein n=1 Tax=Desulfosporosinus nitroreducens TaxID=2018668 RepID=UPI00207CD6E9|nr:RHS repeat-associated core domain-containing protein [Desulfosporosinus nitroreducens]MCO1604048.1 hypothetical protein [Desulfosporosinus nitroreducens]
MGLAKSQLDPFFSFAVNSAAYCSEQIDQNSGSKGNGQDKSIHDNGKDQEKSNDSGKHVGWDKKKLKKVKGNKGKHLGWYKRADHPMNPIDQAPINKPDAYEVINYINDVSLKNTQTLMTTDKDGVYRGVYTFGNERIAERDLVAVEGVPNDPLYYLYDGHNSVTQMINSAGHVRDKYRYDPFGTPMPGGQLSPNTKLFNNPYGYNGEAHDIDSGLQFLRARYYDPSMGRFQTRDSYLGEIMSPLSLNRYVYTANNPVMYSDPSGHIPNPDTFQAYSYKPTLAEQFLQYSPMNARPEPTVYKPITEVIRPLRNPHVVPENSSVGPTISNLDRLNADQASVTMNANKAYAEKMAEKRFSYKNNGCDGLSVIGSFGLGVWDTGKSTVIGLKEMVTHPIDTAEGIINAAAHPVVTSKAIWNQVSNSYEENVINGDANSSARFTGRAVSEALLLVVGPKGLDKLSKAEKVGAEAAEVGNETARIGRLQMDLQRFAEKGSEGAGKAVTYGPMVKGPLPDAIANTFRSGTYTQVVTQGETTLYRVYGGKAGELSSYWTTTKPQGPLQSTIDSALDQGWGNTAENVATIKVPEGTTIYQGAAAQQGGLVGGGSQVYIEKVDSSWLVK